MKWKSHKQHYTDALRYMKGRQQGTIQTYKTPWPTFNDCTMQGIEFNTITLIGARPASGKTLLIDQMIREGFLLNPGLSLRVLSFQLEMFGRTSKLREFSSVTGLTYKELCSSSEEGVVIDDKYITQCHQYAINAAKYPVDIIDDAVTVKEFRTEIIQYMNKFATEDDKGNKHFQHTVVTLDHSVLIKKDKNEASKQEMLANLGEVCTELKKKYPIAFILLTQLNRDTDRPERNENGKYGNYILESDIYGGDGLLQHADIVIGINRPAKRNIRKYGPDKYLIEDDRTLVFHWIKSRNGETGLTFFRAEFERMQIAEMDTPGQDNS
jgi:replicative DNA helicase